MKTLLLSNAALADAYAKARAAKKVAEKAEELLREQVLERLNSLGVETIAGDLFEVDRSTSIRQRLDDKKVRALLTPRKIKEATVDITVTSLSVRVHEEAKVAA